MGDQGLAHRIRAGQDGFDDAIETVVTCQTGDLDPLAPADTFCIARIEGELGMEAGWVADHQHRLAARAGDGPGVDVLGHDDAGDRRGDGIGLEALAGLDPRHNLASRYALAQFDVQRHHPTRIAGEDIALALRRDLDPTAQRQRLAQDCGTGALRGDATGAGGVG